MFDDIWVVNVEAELRRLSKTREFPHVFNV